MKWDGVTLLRHLSLSLRPFLLSWASPLYPFVISLSISIPGCSAGCLFKLLQIINVPEDDSSLWDKHQCPRLHTHTPEKHLYRDEITLDTKSDLGKSDFVPIKVSTPLWRKAFPQTSLTSKTSTVHFPAILLNVFVLQLKHIKTPGANLLNKLTIWFMLPLASLRSA